MIADHVYIAPGAIVRGNVQIGEYSSVWFNAVIRAETDAIVIGRNTNVQDNCVLHLDPGGSLNIGDNVTIGHGAIVHGCTVADNTLIGMGAIILNNASIGKNCIIGAGALVTEGKVIPDNSVVMGSPGVVRRMVTEADILHIQRNADFYSREAEQYMREEA